jgi:hypothetical protein
MLVDLYFLNDPIIEIGLEEGFLIFRVFQSFLIDAYKLDYLVLVRRTACECG